MRRVVQRGAHVGVSRLEAFVDREVEVAAVAEEHEPRDERRDQHRDQPEDDDQPPAERARSELHSGVSR